MISEQIKLYRNLLGYSQMELSYLSGVSLPSIQNIEANKSNPTLDTIERIFDVLTLKINVDIQPVDWDALAALGVPLLTASRFKNFVPSSEKLVHFLKSACLDLKHHPSTDDAERKKEAIGATLIAIRDHYPQFFSKKLKKITLISEFLPAKMTGRHIKLRRQALSVISHYL